ncbi:pyrroline-5-carboxylate reductase [Orbaceae bacterium ac157xtp]
MIKQNIGFIGSGNMGLAIIKGLIASKIAKPEQITVFDIVKEKLKQQSNELKFNVGSSEIEVAKQADILFLAVKPNIINNVLKTIKDSLSKGTILVSIAAGVTLEAMEYVLGKDCKIVRVMPNTPALVNMGMSSLTQNENVSTTEMETISTIFNSLGESEIVPESLIHAVTGVSGSSPAYVFLFIEAMADAAVLAGMPRAQAYKFAAQAVMGSAKMVLETGKHPGELKDMVCSPSGTTIEAVKKLEATGFRSSVIEAINSCVEKSKLMSNTK